MNIFVCIKQVPNTAKVKWDLERGTLIREGVESICNPFDLHAIEEAIRIRERTGKGKVIAVTMGPPQAEEILKEAISMGADDAILISDRAFAGADTLATSYTLSKAIEKVGDLWLIFTGKQAIDGDTAQVGPELAAMLSIPQVTYVRKIVEIDDKRASVERLTDYGYDVVETELPALFTVVKEINEPRLPSLRGKMKAKSFSPTVFTSSNLDVDEMRIGLTGSPTSVKRIFQPEVREAGEKFEGPEEELIGILLEKLKELKII